MKSLTNYIQEKLIIKKSPAKKNKTTSYKYFPKTTVELQDIIKQRIEQEGKEVDLNDIDTSNITDMSELFKETNFNGNISNWDVSNVTNMSEMFCMCKKFNSNISTWDVSNVTSMNSMFLNCESFNQDISNWNVSNVTDMNYMFADCKKFNQDISKWDVSKVKSRYYAFSDCGIQDKYKPNFK